MAARLEWLHLRHLTPHASTAIMWELPVLCVFMLLNVPHDRSIS